MPAKMSDSSEELAERLEKGWQMIEEAKNEVTRSRLTDHFLQLLRQYEQRYDREQEAQ